MLASALKWSILRRWCILRKEILPGVILKGVAVNMHLVWDLPTKVYSLIGHKLMDPGILR